MTPYQKLNSFIRIRRQGALANVLPKNQNLHDGFSQLDPLQERLFLEDGVWLGSNVLVTKDIWIDKGSIIGAQSVVTDDIPSYSISCGVAARVMGCR